MDDLYTPPIPWPSEDDERWEVSIGWDLINGRWEPVALDVRPGRTGEPAPLRADDVRGLKIGELVRRSRPDLEDEIQGRLSELELPETMARLYRTIAEHPWTAEERDEATELVAELEQATEEHAPEREELQASLAVERKRGRPPLHGRDFFERVAAVYRTALLNGDHPTRAVAEAFNVERSTAGKWVWRCRHDKPGSPAFGLLGKTEPRKAGGPVPDDTDNEREEDT